MNELKDCAPVEGVENGEIALMLAQLDEGTREWLGELPGDLTEAEIAWQPFEDGHSIGTLCVHIAEVEAAWLHHVACGEPYRDIESEFLDGALIEQDQVKWPAPPPGRPLSYYIDLMNSVRAQTKELVGALDDPARISTTRSGRTFTLRWLLTHVIGHESYHGGQAVLLLLMQRRKTS
jgi:uncharacterized damage-inducible protein DinB